MLECIHSWFILVQAIDVGLHMHICVSILWLQSGVTNKKPNTKKQQQNSDLCER